MAHATTFLAHGSHPTVFEKAGDYIVRGFSWKIGTRTGNAVFDLLLAHPLVAVLGALLLAYLFRTRIRRGGEKLRELANPAPSSSGRGN